MGAADALHRVGELIARCPNVDLRIAGEREQQVLGGDVLVAHSARLVVGVTQQVDQRTAESRRGGRFAADRRHGGEGLVRAPAGTIGVSARPAQHGHDDAVLLLQERDEQVVRSHLRVPARAGEPAGRGEGLLRLDCESVCLHQKI